MGLRALASATRLAARRLGAAATVAGTSLMLSACSAEPTAWNIEEAISNNAELRSAMETGLQFEQMAKGESPSLEEVLAMIKVEKGSCSQSNVGPGQICNFRMGRSMNGQIEYAAWIKARFFQENGAWHLERMK